MSHKDLTDGRRVEDALRESEARFRAFVLASSDVVYRMSPDWSEMRDLRGRKFIPDTDAPSRSWLEKYIHPDDQPHVMAVIHEAIQTKSVFQLEHRVLRVDGSLGWTFSRAIPLLDANGHIVEWFGAASDITARKEAEAALRESEEKYAAIHDRAPFGIALTKLPEGTFATVNDAFLELLRLTREEVIGRTSLELGISDAASQAEVKRELERRGSLRDFELTRRTGAGAPIDLSISVERVTIGGSEFVLTTAQDITLRKRAEEALRANEAELELILDRTPFMLTRCSRDLRYRYVSRAYARMIGRTPQEVAGRPIVEVLGKDAFETIRPHVEAVLRGESAEYEEEVPFEGVGPRRLQAIYVPERDEQDRVVGWIANIVDVTERRQAEALRLVNAQLVEADRRRTEFLAMLSHELRNPLAPISYGLYTLEHTAPGGEQARRAQSVIRRQVGQLTRLVEDLLDVTRITKGKVQLQRERVDLNDVVQRAVEDHRSVFAQSGLELEVHGPAGEIWMVGDRARLAQVVGNLLQNAAKFTPRGGRATVTVEAEAARGEATVVVRDTGCGIAPEMMSRVFDPFEQADQTLDRSRGGLGLGLALVKGLVERHGGSVVASSDGPSKGAAFTIRLPVEVAAARFAPAARVARTGGAPRRVLVIEDNEDAAEGLREVLEIGDHVVEVAHGGREGIEKARAFRPDVVLCDIGLPEMDGYEVARKMRGDPELGRIALVAVSGYAQPEDVEQARDAGFAAHVAKPPSVESLERVLTEVAAAPGAAAPARSLSEG